LGSVDAISARAREQIRPLRPNRRREIARHECIGDGRNTLGFGTRRERFAPFRGRDVVGVRPAADDAESRAALGEEPIECEGDVAAERVASDRGMRDAERIEQARDVARERFHQIRTHRNARLAEAAQIDADHARAFRELRGLRVPRFFRERESV